MGTAVLGISAFYHDSAAAIVKDGLIVAAAQEERFSRVKHDASFPRQAVKYVLDESGMLPSEVNGVSFYDKPLLKFERLLETYNAFAPRGLASFVKSTPVWIKEKLAMRRLLKNALKEFDLGNKEFYFPEHHLSHSASAYYPSGFSEAAILTIDGVGEWATATIGQGKNNNIKICRELRFPHSLGLLYSSFTYFLGFKVNSGEYKVMGLSPYGDPLSSETIVFKEKILKHLVDVRDDGSFLLNMDYFDFATGLKMIDKVKWEFLFQLRYREPESEILRSHSNFARAAQEVTEMIILKLARTTKELTGSDNLVMAG
ncbi:MAG TPA: carbamoyltransferase N-terminal domain-containing protein, partial [Puia sp.]|nr:carbamoyltransferase N-terminal domain-containing protein [Puia sp.]